MLSTILWTTPQPTDVLSYVYLWAREAAEGRDEGSKDRPAVVVLTVNDDPLNPKVLVVPITTKPPRTGNIAIELPAPVRAHLKLGDKRCWIIANEINRFTWPGPDLRPIPLRAEMSPYYGKIPGKLLEAVRKLIDQSANAGKLNITKRTQ